MGTQLYSLTQLANQWGGKGGEVWGKKALVRLTTFEIKQTCFSPRFYHDKWSLVLQLAG